MKANESEIIGSVEGARILNASHRTFLGWVERQLIPSEKIGGQYILRRSDVVGFTRPRRGPKKKSASK